MQTLRLKCEEYATALLDHTRTSYELEVMLNYDPKGPAYEKGERMKLERLKLGILCKQKTVSPSLPPLSFLIYIDNILLPPDCS